MNLKKVVLACATVLVLFGLGSTRTHAQMPTNFPGITVSNYLPEAVSPGCVFLAVATQVPNVGYYLMIVTNDGSIVWYREAHHDEIYDFKVLSSGLLHYAPFVEPHSYVGGGDVVHEILDENYTPKETITGGNAYVAEGHDFELLPNGNILQFCYYMSEVDMSQIVSGGHPAALVSGGVVQELDAQRNVVFQWRSWDHYGFETNVSSTRAVISAFHLNTIFQDADGHIIWATPSGVHKLNRQTGEFLWHLGGDENQFTFVGTGAGPSDFGGHALNLLTNGHYLIYDNGSRGPSGTTSKVHEYVLDQTNKVATRVWTYSPPSVIKAWHRGNAQRLANGNTFIGWGGASGAAIPTCTEVTPAGEKVFEIFFTNSAVESYRAFRFPWPPVEKLAFTEYELATGNTYTFTNTGVTLRVIGGGGGYNEVTVTREPYAALDPVFPGKAPRALPVRVKLSEVELPAITAEISFDAVSFGFGDPANLTIYYRAQAGQGSLLAQPTTYNPVTHQLRTTLTLNASAGDFGEFIFCYPDLPDVAFAPLLNQPESYRGIQPFDVVAPPLAETGVVYTVNQELPISLSWSPKGLARYFQIQVSTNADFNPADILIDESWMTAAHYLFTNPQPVTSYHYRVKTTTQNDDSSFGESAWSTGAFRTAPPMILVKAPNGGEQWRRGLSYFVQWEDNIAEEVVLALYQGGVFLRTIATNASTAFQWEIPLDLAPGSDYTIKAVSATNATLFDFSDYAFNIDMPVINPGSVVRLADGRLQFGLTAPGATQATVLGSTNLSTWQELQTLPLIDGGALFTDDSATNRSATFYRLRVP